MKLAQTPAPAAASIERRRSKAELIAESPIHSGNNNHNNHSTNTTNGSSNNNNHRYRQPQQQSYSSNHRQGSTASAAGVATPTAVAPTHIKQDYESHPAPTNEFHNQKAPIPTSPSSPVDNNGSSAQQQQPPASGRQSRLSNVSSTKVCHPISDIPTSCPTIIL